MSVFIIVGIAVAVFFCVGLIHAKRAPSSIGVDGEREVSSILQSLPQEYLVLNNVIIPDQKTNNGKNYTTQIDHVIVSPYGIFVIETKNYSGWIFGSEKTKRWKQTFKTTPGHYFYNPIKQNWGHVFALAEQLQLDKKLFKPIVVFSNDCELSVETSTPVVYMSELRGAILNYSLEIMSSSRVTDIFNRLSSINLRGKEIESEHIQSIEERHIQKETSVQDGRCPRCGGELKLRQGKYGPFYGCSNYPKCRFTQNIR